jgi:hypothetical protein
MDSLALAAARALSRGDALGALKRVALRSDPSALALRGIAMAQLGELPRARELLRAALRGFERTEVLARARTVVAEAEVALAMRDFSGTLRAVASAVSVLDARGDRHNAAQARLLMARRQLLLGRLDESRQALGDARVKGLAPAIVALIELAEAELCLRALELGPGRAALGRARRAAELAGVPALLAEVLEAQAVFAGPAARRTSVQGECPLSLDEVLRTLNSDALVIDACSRVVRRNGAVRSLSRRPVLFALSRTLAEAWPEDAARERLIEATFGVRRPDDSHRARLRVEIGRLRAFLRDWARIEATAAGFRLLPADAREIAVVAPPIDGDGASLLALLSDGTAWSTSALATALGASQRTVQRVLAQLETSGRVRSVARGRARRWRATPLFGFTTVLLLPTPAPLI